MKIVNFSQKAVLQIVYHVNLYKSMYVTTTGQMFRDEKGVLAALRMQNDIIEEPTEYVGYIELTEKQLSPNFLAACKADMSKFADLFKSAKVPLQKKVEPIKSKKPTEQKHTVDSDAMASLAAALGVDSKPKKGPKSTGQAEDTHVATNTEVPVTPVTPVTPVIPQATKQ